MFKFKAYLPLILLGLLLFLSFYISQPFLTAVFFGILLAYFVYPLYRWLGKKIKSPTLNAFLLCLLVLLLLVIPATFLINLLVKESYVVYLLVKQKMALGLFDKCAHPFCEILRDLSENQDLQFQIQEITKKITNLIIEKGSALLLSFPRILLNLVIVFFTMFYALKDGLRWEKSIANYLHHLGEKYSLILGRVEEIIHGIVYGYFLIALLQGVLGGLGFFIFGISSPVFWGVIMFILSLLPLVGTALIWFPAVLALAFESYLQGNNFLLWKSLGLLIYSLLFVSSLDNLLRPKIVGDKAKLHPLFILVGILGGIMIFGPLGVIIGPLVLGITVILLKIFLTEKERKN